MRCVLAISKSEDDLRRTTILNIHVKCRDKNCKVIIDGEAAERSLQRLWSS